MNRACPQEGLDAWLVCGDVIPDIYCVCLQEVACAEQWGQWRAAIAKSLQNAGPYEDVKKGNKHTHITYVSSFLFFSPFLFFFPFH